MSLDAVQAIDAIEPYKGGKGDQLWVLHQLNNIHKHRLVVAVGSAFRSVDAGSLLRRKMQEFPGPGHIVPAISINLRPRDRLYPLKAGDKLFVDAPDAEIDQEMEFGFHVSIGEPGVVEGESLLETLHSLANLIDDILTRFAPLP